MQSANGSAQNGWNCIEATRAVEQWKRKLRLTDPRRYRRGSEVFHGGTSYDAGILIERGIMALHYLLPNGRETLFMLAFPGELVNLTAPPPSKPTGTAGTAVTNCDVYRIDVQRIESAEQQDPEIPKMLYRSLQEQVAKRTKALVELKSLSPAERLEHHLCELAKVLGCDVNAKPVRVVVPLKDTEMAMLLGLSDRQFKRVKKSLQEDGRLRFENSRMFVLPEC
jgi:CRP-like cAMP-binding protein